MVFRTALHKHLKIPRYYLSANKSVPVNASESAYCAAAYLRTIYNERECTVSFITPLKKVTLPRLELLGAIIGARLCKYVTQHLDLKLSQVKLWTDSMITLHWIKSSAKQWKPLSVRNAKFNWTISMESLQWCSKSCRCCNKRCFFQKVNWKRPLVDRSRMVTNLNRKSQCSK